MELNERYPLPTYEGAAIYRNGVFQFNISRIMEATLEGTIPAKEELVEVSTWFQYQQRGRVNEEHLSNVNVS
ncbi:hypothetical protein [Robertmurraya korlensis]|uniref:hypothetical protein n=1 Tax=Robertmurraya korlensis TaxID=519977 RepID=UPI00203FAAB9|nr:hypothetical protein [Robertmurraya korlensis]